MTADDALIQAMRESYERLCPKSITHVSP